MRITRQEMAEALEEVIGVDASVASAYAAGVKKWVLAQRQACAATETLSDEDLAAAIRPSLEGDG